MEEGIGKNNAEQCADDAEEAKRAAEQQGKTDGFNGYEGDEKRAGAGGLKDWQLELLLKEESDNLIDILCRHKDEMLEKI